MRRLLLCFALLSILCIESAGAINIRRLRAIDGLANNSVSSILQDDDGVMWIGTIGGLNRYNGIEFESVKIDNSLGVHAQQFNRIEIDHRLDNIWLGIGDDMVIYNKKRNHFSLLRDMVGSDSYKFPRVKFDKNGDAWLYERSFLHHMRATDDGYSAPESIGLESIILDIELMERGGVLIATQGGLYVRSGVQIQYISDIVANNIVSIDNQIYLLTSKGVYHYDQRTIDTRRVLDLAANDMLCVNGVFWLGCSDGLYRAESGIGGFEFANLERVVNNTSVKVLVLDFNQQIWVGTSDGVVVVNTDRSFIYNHRYPNNLFNNNVRAVGEDNSGNLWVASQYDRAGLLFVPKDRYQDAVKVDVDGNIFNISCVGDDLYMASNRLVRLRWNKSYNAPKFDIEYFDIPNTTGNAMVCTPSPDGKSIWVGVFADGLYRFDIEGETFEKVDIYNNIIYPTQPRTRNVVFDPNSGNMWVATSKGLYIIPSQRMASSLYVPTIYRYRETDSGSLGYDYVLSVKFDDRGYAWIGTYGGGLYRTQLNESGMPTHFEHIDGLSNNIVKSIEIDAQRNVWVSTSGGLCRYDWERESMFVYNQREGVGGYEFGDMASTTRRSGEIVFGSVYGLNRFYSEDIVRDTTPPQLYFEAFYLDNNEVNVGDMVDDRVLLERSINSCEKITLRPNERYFGFKIAALYYKSPKSNKYRYKLEGVDRDWMTVSYQNRVVQYPAVPSGSYTFCAQVANLDGAWSDIRRIEVTIEKPWWQWLLVQIFGALLLIAAICVMIHHRNNLVRNKNRLEFAELTQRRLEELQQMQSTFFTNISHEFRTPLSLIVAPIDELKQSIVLSGRDRRMVDSVAHNANMLMRLINQLLDFTRFDNGLLEVRADARDMVAFQRGVIKQFDALARSSGVSVSLNSSESVIGCCVDYNTMEHVMYNLLSNALKYTPIKGSVLISIVTEGRDVIVSVSDNGSGISESVQGRLFERFVKDSSSGGTGIGLNFTKNLVEMNGGVISYTTSSDGTTFSLVFPNTLCELSSKSVVDVVDVVDVSLDAQGDEQVALPPRREGDRKTILIVEDNAELLEFLCDHFASEYRVKSATNGQLALTAVKAVMPDLVISDLVMPEMMGDQMCREIKANTETSHIPVVLLTAKVSTNNQKDGYDCGADMYCTKPFDINLLDKIVRSLIDNRDRLQSHFRSSLDNRIDDMVLVDSNEVMINKAILYIEKNISDTHLTINQVASYIGVSQYQFNKMLADQMGVQANAFIRNMRLKYAAKLLLDSNKNISEVVFASGFSDMRYFRQRFAEMFGTSPSQYKKMNQQ